jgi:hypothetical protein
MERKKKPKRSSPTMVTSRCRTNSRSSCRMVKTRSMTKERETMKRLMKTTLYLILMNSVKSKGKCFWTTSKRKEARTLQLYPNLKNF